MKVEVIDIGILKKLDEMCATNKEIIEMTGYTVIRKDNKVFLRNEFWGDMLVYGIKSGKPYVKRLGSKFYITGDLAVEVKEA